MFAGQADCAFVWSMVRVLAKGAITDRCWTSTRADFDPFGEKGFLAWQLCVPQSLINQVCEPMWGGRDLSTC